jgi:hypothetical protein
LAVLGCNQKERGACKAAFETAQALVNTIDKASTESVSSGLSGVEHAIETCRAAGLGDEVKELEKAKNQLDAHKKWLADRPVPKKGLTTEEVEELVKNGDPNCPKGQAYKHQGKGEQIRCTGSQAVDFDWKRAETYYGDRNYKLRPGKTPNVLTAEFGAEHFVFYFDEPKSTKSASCVMVYPSPQISWQEALSKLTGVGPHKLKERDGQVKTARGTVPYKIEEDAKKLVVLVGQCRDKL